MDGAPRVIIGDFKVDPYSVLGVDRTATETMIKRAYNCQALKTHPDRVPANCRSQAEEQFKLLTAARDFLLDRPKRAAYDRLYPNTLKIAATSPKYAKQSSDNQAELKKTMSSNRTLLDKLRKELQHKPKEVTAIKTPSPTKATPTYVSRFQASLSHEEYERQILAKHGRLF